jgi:isoquinoline 1-oxidoreductase beta subunit
MEPPSAVAFVKDGKCEVWSCCQDPQAARATVAGAIGMDEKNVTSRVTLLGGAFGRKSKPDFAAEAAILSRQFGVPVKVTWTREDGLQHAYYRPPPAWRRPGQEQQGNRSVQQQRVPPSGPPSR